MVIGMELLLDPFKAVFNDISPPIRLLGSVIVDVVKVVIVVVKVVIVVVVVVVVGVVGVVGVVVGGGALCMNLLP